MYMYTYWIAIILEHVVHGRLLQLSVILVGIMYNYNYILGILVKFIEAGAPDPNMSRSRSGNFD